MVQAEIGRLQERKDKARKLLIADSLDPDDYRLEKKECDAGVAKLEDRLTELTAFQINIDPLMEDALQVLSKLDDHYTKSGTLQKRELIDSIFPEKLVFDGTHYRTTNINEAVQLIFDLDKAFG